MEERLATFGIGPGAFRFALALTVVIHHCTRFFPYGSTAVYVFFVLSGFWMNRMYDGTYAHKRAPIATYAFSRALRIYPLYLTLIALVLLAWGAVHAATGRLAELLAKSTQLDVIARNVVVFGLGGDGSPKILTPAWSLDYELQFYVALPVLVALRRRLGDGALWTLGAVSALAVAARTYGSVRSQLLEYLALFIIGMLLHRPSGSAPSFGRRTVQVTTALTMLLVAAPYVLRNAGFGHAMLHARDASWLGLNIYEAFNVLVALSLVPFVDHNVRGVSGPFDRRLGGASYALYLLHWGVLCVYGSYAEGMGGAHKLIFAALYVIVSCALALLVQRFIDAPLEARRHAWLAQRG